MVPKSLISEITAKRKTAAMAGWWGTHQRSEEERAQAREPLARLPITLPPKKARETLFPTSDRRTAGVSTEAPLRLQGEPLSEMPVNHAATSHSEPVATLRTVSIA